MSTSSVLTHLGLDLKMSSFVHICLSSVACSHLAVLIDEQIAEGIIDLKSKELETVTKQLDSAKSQNIDLKSDLHKLQQEVQKLRAALEQSITSLNRMSSDSDFYVDRSCSRHFLTPRSILSFIYFLPGFLVFASFDSYEV